MKFIIIILILLSGSVRSSAQVSIQELPEVSTLMTKFISQGKQEEHIQGWRIKIISTTDRRQLENTTWRFRNQYPEVYYKVGHEAPYYSLITGAFETRYDVEYYLNQYKEDFEKAIPYRDKILKSELFEDNGN